jgi:hypothetical protein
VIVKFTLNAWCKLGRDFQIKKHPNSRVRQYE